MARIALYLSLNLLGGLFYVPPVRSHNSSLYGHIIGIDLGSTYSSVAVKRVPDGPIEIIPDEYGHKTIPSLVSFQVSGNVVGEEAKNLVPTNLAQTLFYPKFLLGRHLDKDSLPELNDWPALLDSHGAIVSPSSFFSRTFCDDYTEKTPHHVGAAILSKLKSNAEAYLGEAVTHAVIAVPPYFNALQRRATIEAANAAGLQALSIINDSVAAIIAYDLSTLRPRPYVLVHDFGGDAFTATVNRLEPDGTVTMIELQTDRRYSSRKIDDAIAEHLAQQYERHSGNNVTTDQQAMARLRVEAERLKIRLDTHVKAPIAIENFSNGDALLDSLTRKTFDTLAGEIVWKSIQLTETALMKANYSETKQGMLDDIDVILVGGSTRIPRARRLLKEYFETKDFKSSIDPNEVVAYGAAKHAASFYDSDTTTGIPQPSAINLKQKPSQWLSMHMAEGGDDAQKLHYIHAWFSAVIDELDSPGTFLGMELGDEEKTKLRSAVGEARRRVEVSKDRPLHDLLQELTGIQELMDKLEHHHLREGSTHHDEL